VDGSCAVRNDSNEGVRGRSGWRDARHGGNRFASARISLALDEDHAPSAFSAAPVEPRGHTKPVVADDRSHRPGGRRMQGGRDGAQGRPFAYAEPASPEVDEHLGKRAHRGRDVAPKRSLPSCESLMKAITRPAESDRLTQRRRWASASTMSEGAAANPLIATTPPLTVRTSDQKETFPVPVMTSEAEIGALLRSHLPLADFFAISKKLPVIATEPVILA
jgi:hypothetical protein